MRNIFKRALAVLASAAVMGNSFLASMPLAAYGADAGGIVGDDTSVDIGNTSQGAAGVDDVVASGTCGENLIWEITLNEDGTTHTLTISGSGDMTYEGYDAPWYNDYKYYESINKVNLPEGLTKIEQYAFYEFKALTSIEIPYGVISIGKGAFEKCDNLISITIPDSVTTVEMMAFYECYNLTNAILSKNLSAVSERMFEGCIQLTDITIPESVESIDVYAFSGCLSLTEVTIPNGVTTIGNYAFNHCSSLIKMSIPSSMTSIGAAFYDCDSISAFEVAADNSAYTSVDGVLYTKDEKTLVAFPAAKSSSYTIPDGVTTIGIGAFGYGEITDIDIPDSVTAISDNAFYACKKLTNIEISANVTSLGSSAFYACENLYIHYLGAEEQWNAVPMGNSYTLNGVKGVHCVGDTPTWTPDEDGTTHSWRCMECGTALDTQTHTDDDGQPTYVPNNLDSGKHDVIYDCCEGTEEHTAEPVYSTIAGNSTQHNAFYSCCGGNAIEEHTFDETSICTLCDAECIHSSVDRNGCSACEKPAVAHVVNEEGAGSYYCNIVTALSYGDAVASLLTDYTLTEDLTIPANMILDTNGHTLTVPEGMTLTNNGGLVFGDTSQYFGEKGTYAEIDTAAVKIGTSDGIIFENKLYYLGELCEALGNEIIGINLEKAAPNTYYIAGEGYAIYEDSDILRLHNAKITIPNSETSGTGSRYAIYSNGNLNIHFSGENQLKSGNLDDTNAGIYVEGDLTMTAVGENAELTVQCGSSSGNTPGISANSLTVNGGTITSIGGISNGSSSYGIYVDTDLIINSGKVNAYGGSGMMSLGVGAGTITVADDTELYAKGGEGVLAAADVMAETLSDNVNALGLAMDESEGVIIYTVYGDLILTEDLTISNPYAEMEGAGAIFATFTVPTGTSLTVNQGINLNLSRLAAEDINFIGTVSNNGTILLPASFAIQNAPKSGNVKIGEKSYTWNSGNTNWICNDLSSHFGGEATCTEQAVCEICGTSYGELDPNNHASENYTYTDNGDGTHTKVHECGYVENASETHSHVYTANETTDTIAHICICGDVEMSFTLNIPTAAYGDSPMAVPHFTCSDTTYAGEFPVITIDGEENNFPTNAGTYEVIMTWGEVSVSGEYVVEKAEASVLTEPMGNTMIYDGEAQELITAGTAKGGTMMYALSEDGDYTTEIPTATNAGDYTVWYYVQGDENHIDSPKVSVAVEIVKAKITAMTPPEDKTLTGYFTNAEDIIAILPTTIEIESEDGTNELPVTWTFDGEFDTSSLAEHNFTWTADVGDLTANGFAVFGEITVTNVEYIEINEKNFPDETFRNYVNENFDTTDDDVLTADEISAVTMIRVSNEGIADLTGIEYFIKLSYLDCSSNQLKFLDVSKNTKLSYLGCSYNQMERLDVSNNANLLQLNCNNNQLTTLDIDSCTEIDTLLCAENLLTALDVSNHKELSYLACSYNQLTSLDVSGCTALNNLYCDTNQLTSLDVSTNTALTDLNCASNQLTSLDVSNNMALIDLYCEENIFTIELIEGKFDLSTMPEGFDITKVSEWHNGTVNGTILSNIDSAENITYTYTLGNGETAIFTLKCKGQIYDIADAEIVFGDALTYNGEEQKQIVIVYYDGIHLSSVHCRISGNRGTDAGNYTLTIEGLVDFYGTKTVNWTIAKATPEAVPIISEDEYFVGDALPEIGYESKISGIIEWLTELVNGLAEGENELEWQFTPDDADNYEVVTGTAVVEAQTTTTSTTTETTTSSTTTSTTETTTSSTTASTTTETTTSSTTTSTTTKTTTSSTTTSTTETTTSSTSTSTTTSTTTSSTTTSTTTETTTSSTTASTTTSTTTSSTSTSTTTETTTSSTTTSTTTETTTSSTSTSTTTETTTSSTTTSTTTETTTSSTTTETTTSSTTTSTTTETTTSSTTASTTTETTTSSTTTSTTTETTSSSTTTSTTTETTTSSTSTFTTTETTTLSTTTSTTTETTTSSTTTSTTTETTTSSTTTSTTTETTTSSTTTSTTTETTTSSTTTSTTTETTTSSTTTITTSSSTTTSTTTETTTSSTTTSTTTETTTSSITTSTTTTETTSSTTTSTTTETTTSSTTTSTTTKTTTSSTTTSTTTETTTSSITTSTTTTETTTSSTSTSTTTETTTSSTSTSTTTETTTSSTTTSTSTETTSSSTTTFTTTETTTSSTSTSTTTETTTSSTTTSTTTETTTSSTTTSTTTETTTSSTTTSTTTKTTTSSTSTSTTTETTSSSTTTSTTTETTSSSTTTSATTETITSSTTTSTTTETITSSTSTSTTTETTTSSTTTTLPQTGYSVIYNYIMLAAAAMMIFGIYAMAKSRKRDEE